MIQKSDREPEFFSDGDEFEFEETPYEPIDWREFGVDPTKPTKARPGSDEKVRILAARYAAGLPLWHEDDCYDHGEAEETPERPPVELFNFSDIEDEEDLDDCELIDDLD